MTNHNNHFLQNAWYCASWSDEVGEGMFERLVARHPLLLYRTADGNPVALKNMCPHRFSPLHTGKLVDDIIQCPYHGLRFDSSGACVYNPHSSGHIPETLFVRTYPVVERYDMLWVWLGEPELANPDTIPDFSYQTDASFHRIGGVIDVNAGYQMITDNLMDLSHVEFVHKGGLGTDSITRGELEVLQDGTTVWANRWCPDGPPPPAMAPMLDNPNQAYDFWMNMRWDAPAHMVIDAGVAPRGKPREDGIWIYGTAILTPKDETSTTYFWTVTRNYATDDPTMDAMWQASIDIAFLEQDKPTIEAQQAMIALHDATDIDDGLRPVVLGSDAGPVRCRHVLKKLRDSNGVELPDPRNHALSELVENSRGSYNGRVTPIV